MCVDSVLFELILFNLGPCAKKPIICLLLIWHVLGPLKTFISTCARACVCAKNEGECMRERERERDNSRAVDSLIHSIFVVAFILFFFFLYFTYSKCILDSLQN